MSKNKIIKTKTREALFYLAAIMGGFFIWANFVQAATLGDAVINEIAWMGTNASPADEWLELYNSTNQTIDLTGWQLFEAGGGTLIINLTGQISAQGYYLIERTDDNTIADVAANIFGSFGGNGLSNSGEYLVLKNAAGETIDSVNASSGWPAGTSSPRASMERKSNGTWQTNDGAIINGHDAQNNPIVGTPKAVNSGNQSNSDDTASSTPPTTTSPAPGTSGTTSSPPPPAPQKVKISEILANPDKEQKEFVELVNNNYSSITLEGWKLADGKKVVILPTVTLVANEHRAFFGDDTKIVLNNEGDVVSLYDKDGELADKLSYGSTVKGQALAYNQAQDKFVWSAKPTPNTANEITKTNEPPVARITLSNNPVAPNEEVMVSAAESSDPDDDALTFFWTIGESWQASGQSFYYRFNDLGARLIGLRANDGSRESLATTTINILPANEVVSLRGQKAAAKTSSLANPQGIDNTLSTSAPPAANQIFINEIFPNPAGRDDDEWIELFNPNAVPVSLVGWSLDDGEGGSKPYKFGGQTIAAKSYLLIKKKESGLLLNNNNETARLFNPEQKLIDEAAYKDAPENESYGKDDDEEWFWTKNTTPGKANNNTLISTDVPSLSRRDRGGSEGVVADKLISPNSAMSTLTLPSPLKGEGMPIDIDLANIRELELGAQVKVQGTVAVEPGVLAKTYFYITGSPGIQVYYSQRDWPKLALGDVVGVIGELTETSGEMRLKVADKGDIVPLYKTKPPQAEEIETGDIGDNTEGWLVKITGELAKKQGASWHLDDGSGEVRVVFQNGTKIKKPEAKAGDWLEVIGLVSETRSGYRLLPRYQDDVKLVDAAKLGEIQGRVLGAAASTTAAAATENIQRFRIPANDKPRKILTYLLITSGALIILLAGLLIKLRLETKKRLEELKKR